MSSISNWLSEAFHALSNVHPGWVVLALVLHVGNIVFRSLTWRNVLAGAYPKGHLSTWRVGLSYTVGAALNGYLPARGGDATKIALVRVQHPDTSAVTIASSTSVLVIFDVLVGLTILMSAWALGALPATPEVPGIVSTALGSPLLVGGLAVAALGAAWQLKRHASAPLRRAWSQMAQGVAVLRAPGRYARTVVSIQALAWVCRIGVVFSLLHAFGISASLPLAALVVVVGGLSTLVPVPGGAGTQQALAVFVLSGIAATSSALSFSIGMQVGITLVNSTLGLIAAMLIFGRLHPVHAIRSAIGAMREQHPAPVILPAPVPAAPAP